MRVPQSRCGNATVILRGFDPNEPLHAPSLTRFRDEKIPLRVHGEVMRDVELPSPVSRSAKRTQDLQRSSVEDIHLLVGCIDHECKPLLWIA